MNVAIPNLIALSYPNDAAPMPSWKGELTHVRETAWKPAVNLGYEIAVPRVVPSVPHPPRPG
jgi:hypothetical protein